VTPPNRELDVRPILRGGGEQFQAIMEAVSALAPGQGLRLLATFKPQPLFGLMEGRGFDHAAREIGNGDWEVIFSPRTSSADSVATSPGAGMAGTWPDPECHLDLTDLDPPEPMTRILAAAESMEPGSVLFALLAREPIFLFPELQRRGHQWVGNFDETGSTYRIMIRVGALLE
jgi:uncharacterized protein (DUF2249 family)